MCFFMAVFKVCICVWRDHLVQGRGVGLEVTTTTHQSLCDTLENDFPMCLHQMAALVRVSYDN